MERNEMDTNVLKGGAEEKDRKRCSNLSLFCSCIFDECSSIALTFRTNTQKIKFPVASSQKKLCFLPV